MLIKLLYTKSFGGKRVLCPPPLWIFCKMFIFCSTFLKFTGSVFCRSVIKIGVLCRHCRSLFYPSFWRRKLGFCSFQALSPRNTQTLGDQSSFFLRIIQTFLSKIERHQNRRNRTFCWEIMIFFFFFGTQILRIFRIF